MVILAVGADEIGLADCIRAVRIDFVTPSVSVLAFPRDLWVSIPGLEDLGITQGKINTAYIYGNRYLKP